jgi:hypothetical protein
MLCPGSGLILLGSFVHARDRILAKLAVIPRCNPARRYSTKIRSLLKRRADRVQCPFTVHDRCIGVWKAIPMAEQWPSNGRAMAGQWPRRRQALAPDKSRSGRRRGPHVPVTRDKPLAPETRQMPQLRPAGARLTPASRPPHARVTPMSRPLHAHIAPIRQGLPYTIAPVV